MLARTARTRLGSTTLALALGCRIGDIRCPTRYFADASSINGSSATHSSGRSLPSSSVISLSISLRQPTLIFFGSLGVEDTGLLWGEPSPLRSDEFAVWTPFTQAAVRNGFQRFNETSPYGEDLRNFNGLPLWDWALLFKPQFWGFFFLPADRAFSLYHTLLIGSFLIGWSLVLRSWCFPAVWAAFASLLLFFSGTTQFAWTTWGPLLALLPFPILVFGGSLKLPVKFVLLVWLMTVFLLSHLYPPVLISLALATVFLLAAFRSDAVLDWRNVVVSLTAVLIAALIVRLYFGDVFRIMAATVYPGQRSVAGGELPWQQGLAHFFPFLTTRGDVSLIGMNAYEVSTASSYLPLATLIFLDWSALSRALRSPNGSHLRWACGLSLVALLLFAAWMFVPIPAQVGALLLLDRVPPARMMNASAMLLLTLSLLLLREAGARWSLARLLLMSWMVIAVWLIWKAGSAPSLKEALLDSGYLDLTIVPALCLAGLWLWYSKRPPVRSLLAACLAVNILGWSWVNPLQSARPIFADHDTPVMRAYREMQARDPRGWLVAEGMPGASLNGLGFKSISHVTIMPQLTFFRPYFPQLSDDAFNVLFNRFAHIRLDSIEQPELAAADAVLLPIDAFLAERERREMQRRVIWQPDAPQAAGSAGFLDQRQSRDRNEISLSGWGMLDASDPDNSLVLVSRGAFTRNFGQNGLQVRRCEGFR